MNRAAFALLVVVILQVLPLAHQNAAQPASHSSNANDGHATLPSTPAASTVVGRPECKEPTKKHELPPNNDDGSIGRWSLYVNGALAVATFVLAIFAVKQANAAKDNAQAAKLSAQAVINAERAWVVAELHPMGRKLKNNQWANDSGVLFTTEQILDSKHEEYSLRIKNIGRTPAQIISFQMSYSCLAQGVTELPSGSPDESNVREFEHLLADGEPIEILPPFNPSEYMRDSWSDIKAETKKAVFHGWVKYRHMISDEDCWWDYCYCYTPSLDRLTQVGRYTKHRKQQK